MLMLMLMLMLKDESIRVLESPPFATFMIWID